MTSDVAIQMAQAVPDEGGSPGLNMLLFVAAMFVLMWALLIRPQQRQQREHKKMLEQIQKGDHVVTTGGMHGRVTGVTDDVLTVEIAERVRVKLDRSAVSARRSTGESAEASPAKEKSA